MDRIQLDQNRVQGWAVSMVMKIQVLLTTRAITGFSLMDTTPWKYLVTWILGLGYEIIFPFIKYSPL